MTHDYNDCHNIKFIYDYEPPGTENDMSDIPSDEELREFVPFQGMDDPTPMYTD